MFMGFRRGSFRGEGSEELGEGLLFSVLFFVVGGFLGRTGERCLRVSGL